MKHATVLVATVLIFLFAGSVGGVDAQTSYSHLVVIVGAAGDDVYQEVFHNWAIELIDAATNKLSLSPDQVTYLGERPDLSPQRIAARSSRENIEKTIARLGKETGPDDQIFFVLIGHGTGAGEQSRFNIPGRDITALEYDGMLSVLATQEIGFVNTASASGDFARVLSGLNRVIVTATRDGRQNNQTIFPRFFVQAFSQDVADLDKDERVSLLEAYNYASREVKRFYEDDGRMLTETSQLEDNGDGEGSYEPLASKTDGKLAQRMFLDGFMNPLNTATTPQAHDSSLRVLYVEQRELRERIEQLRLIKDTMSPELYAKELETLLIALALKDREIRARGGGQ
ncbi:MAG: hypothetical protein VX385_01040 [Acidobacteriota bacterium]|nr:hypothetical protein [Acidobacteriota bacterium]